MLDAAREIPTQCFVDATPRLAVRPGLLLSLAP